MAQKTILVLGTAPDVYLAKLLDRLSKKEKNIHLFVAVHKVETFTEKYDDNISIHFYEGHIRWYKWQLLSHYLEIKPDEIVFIKGEKWFHDNVVTTIRFWVNFNRKPNIVLSDMGEEPGFYPIPNPFSKVTLAVFVFLFLILNFTSYQFHFLLEMWAGLLFVEICLKLFVQAARYDQKKDAGNRVDLIGTGQLQTIEHTKYGWINKPNMKGKFISQIGRKKEFCRQWELTHEMDGCRKISDNHINPQGKKINLYGCSITYGQGVRDEDTFAWKLQKSNQNYNIKNYGVGAYSLYQILLLMQDTLKKDHPEVVILGFHQELERRCTNPFPYRMFWLQTMKSPSCIVKRKRLHIYKPTGYVTLPLSEVIHTFKILEYLYNRLVFMGRAKPEIMRKTNEYLLLEIRSICEEMGIKLLITCVESSENYYEFFLKHQFSWVLTKKFDDWDLAPFDGHPNRKAHRKIAENTSIGLYRLLEGKTVVPSAEKLENYANMREGKDFNFIYPHF